jgi:hypothetical protein
VWRSLLSYSQYTINKVIARIEKVSIFVAKDFPVEEDSLEEVNESTDIEPCPPRVSTQSPSIFFCK